jgi:hypothetical protein
MAGLNPKKVDKPSKPGSSTQTYLQLPSGNGRNFLAETNA